MVLTARPSPGVAITLLQGFAGVSATGMLPSAVCARAPAAETMPRVRIADSKLLEHRMRSVTDWEGVREAR
jgi:hypothetical protein